MGAAQLAAASGPTGSPGPRLIGLRDAKAPKPVTRRAPWTAWRAIGWFGLILALIGAADVAIQWYPVSFNSPEWEFGTIAVSFGSLPVLTIGLVAMLASFLARGSRAGVIAMSVVFVLLVVLVGLAYTLFLLDVPLVLKLATGPGGMAIKKAVVRTSVMGLGFGAAYVGAAGLSFNYLSRRKRDA
jgi:hypothetical protein